jgi:hypothetical protein
LTTRTVLAKIAKVLKEFAEKEEGLGPDQYQILFRVLEDWGEISVVLVLDDFKGLSEREMWDKVHKYLQEALTNEGGVGYALGLTVREKRQVERGGIYAIPESYVEAADLLAASSLDR